jgi:glycosyltransferase involved in cell wall biosynthesis
MAVATNKALADLAEYLSAQGNEVHVICSGPHFSEETPNSLSSKKTHNGVYIHRIAQLKAGNWNSPINIAYYFISAGILAIQLSGKLDAIVTLDFPPLLGIWGNIIQLITAGRVKHICWIMDMLTESRFLLGLWQKEKLVHRLVDYLHVLPSRYASLNIVLGKCMRERLINRHADPSRIKVIGMWHDSNLIKPIKLQPSQKAQILNNELAEKFIVMYSGNADRIHDLGVVCKSILALKDNSLIHFVFVGNSDEILKLESFAFHHNLKNFTRLEPVAWDKLNFILSVANLHLVALKDGLQGICVPSKLYGIMASAKPVIFIGPKESQSAIDIIESQAGFVIHPSDSELLTSTIISLANNISECQHLSNNAYQNFMQNYDYPIRCSLWEEALQMSINNH